MTATHADVGRPGDGCVVLRAASGTSIVGRVRLATSFWARFRGLMGSAPLDAEAGLYLPVNSIHMLFMRGPIDAVFVAAPDSRGDRRIVAIRADLPAWRGLVLPVKGAEGALELQAGTAARAGLAVGDVLRFAPTADAAGVDTASRY